MKKIKILTSCLFCLYVFNIKASCDCWMDPAPPLYVYEARPKTAEELRKETELYQQRKHQHDKLPLHRAVIGKNIPEISRLCSLNVDPNIRDAVDKKTPLCWAMQHVGYMSDRETDQIVRIIKILLAHPAINPNIPDSEGTPLMIACEQLWNKKNFSVLKALLASKKVNVNTRFGYYCETPLYRVVGASSFIDRTILQLLLGRADINPSIPTIHGITPLHRTIQRGDTKAACMLIAHPNTQFNVKLKGQLHEKFEGMTPIELARSLDNKQVVQHILDAYEQSKKAAIMVLMAHHNRAGVHCIARIISTQTLKALANFVLKAKPCPLSRMQEYRECTRVAAYNRLVCRTTSNMFF